MRAALLIECSPRLRSSASRTAAERVVARLRQREPGLRLLRRDLAAHPPPLVDLAFTQAMHAPPAEQSVDERTALATSEALIAELETTEALVISTPMHNFTVPAVLKAWIDQVVRIGRTFQRTPAGKEGLLADRPTYVVVASGGFIVGDRARQPDFLTPYLKAILATLGIHTVAFLYLEALGGARSWSPGFDAEIDAWLDRHLPKTTEAGQPALWP